MGAAPAEHLEQDACLDWPIAISLAFRRPVTLNGAMPRRRPPRPPPPPLTIAEVLAWADAHYERAGSWPNAFSGPIPEAPLGTNWRHRGVGNRGGHWMKAERPCWCCEDRLLPSIESCNCSGNNCVGCGLCLLHCDCRDLPSVKP
jgi:hypothetical protein